MSGEKLRFRDRLTTDERRVLGSALPNWRRSLPGQLAGILTALSAVGLLATSAFLITRASEHPPVLFLMIAVVGVRAFALARGFFRYLERLSTHDVVFRQLTTVRIDLLRRLIPLAPAGLRRTRRGSLVEAMVSDVDEQQNLSLRVVQPLVTSGGVAAVAIVFVWFLSPFAAGVLTLAIVLALIIATVTTSVVSSRAERSIAPLRTRLSSAVVDYLDSHDVLVAYGAEAQYRTAVGDADAALTRMVSRRAVGVGATAAILSLFSGLAVTGIVLATLGAVGSGSLTGPLFAVVVLVPMAVFEVLALVPLALSAWRQVRASASRLAELAPSAVPAGIPVDFGDSDGDGPDGHSPHDRGSAATLPPVIELSGAELGWPGTSQRVLRDVHLAVHRGERVLIEGDSGSGKSLLAHALVRFVDVSAGQYLLSGRNVASMTPTEVRSVVGLCEQDPYLFDESIRQNLLFASPDAADDDLEAVLDRVGLAAWAEERGGLDARVGERGQLVSGGEAQRLALARALLRDFPTIIFDEPTANVDGDRATALLADLLSAADGRTVIVISHADVPDDLIDRTFRVSEGRVIADPIPG